MPSNAPTSNHSLLQHPGFLRYWLTRVASSFAFQMVAVAVGWQIYDITHRALDLGLIGLAQFVPSLVLALPAGHLADRYDRRRIVIACLILECAAMTVLTLGSLLHRFEEPGILAMILIIGCAKAFEFPTMLALLPSLVPPAIFPRAVAANSGAFLAATIMGPALGGFLYVAGAGVVYSISALLCLAAVVLMWRLRLERPPQRREPATFNTLFSGIGFIRQRPVIFGAISLDLFAVLLGGATALLPVFARDILHTGPWGLGLLRAAPGVGALAMSIWLTHHPLRRRVGHTMFYAVAGFGLATIVFGLSTSFPLSLAALVALGALDMPSMVIRGTLVQLETPDEMRGRVSAVNAIFINTSNQLGEFESGITAQWFGTVPATVIGGIGTLIVVALWM
ncbi:MAG TPA: MFS transporter, partial [Gammaproteobacteria bacterium]|nr:MFS transporter [Gammaproteobacteria bacterium]